MVDAEPERAVNERDEIVDHVFALQGRTIALDYADRLWRELLAHLAWLADEPGAGVHPLAGVSAGAEELYLTRRARLVLRLPAFRAADLDVLVGRRLDLGGEVGIGALRQKPLAPAKVLYSRLVSIATAQEDLFLARCAEELAALGAGAAQLVCGRGRRLAGADGAWHGFSLMVAGLGAEQSLVLQRAGLGGGRERGCGIFVPHKSVVAVGEA